MGYVLSVTTLVVTTLVWMSPPFVSTAPPHCRVKAADHSINLARLPDGDSQFTDNEFSVSSRALLAVSISNCGPLSGG